MMFIGKKFRVVIVILDMSNFIFFSCIRMIKDNLYFGVLITGKIF